jgi:hypothetical protein
MFRSSFAALALCLFAAAAFAQESLWIEAEHLTGVHGYCWPMGKPEMKKTAGHWALSGPGWAAEWTQGGESGFLSIATGADDDKAVATKPIEIPLAGKYYVWVRYGDWRETPERFQVQLDQPNSPGKPLMYGEQAVIEEDNELKLYWNWAFGWAKQEVNLTKGPATLKLLSTTKESQPRQIDVIVLTTDAKYRPTIKDRPRNYAWEVLDGYRKQKPRDLEPLARKTLDAVPANWTPNTFKGQFRYLWNTSHTSAAETWLSDKPNRVKVPYNITQQSVREGFEKQYAGKDDVPIFSDPRVTPTFHGVGAGIFTTDAKTGDVNPTGALFAKWLDANPNRAWGMMMNYHNGQPIGEKGQAMFAKYRDRYVGSISGESLGYFYPPDNEMKAATENAKTRRQLVEAFSPLSLKYNADKYRAVYGKDLDANPYQDVIACLSTGNIVFMPISLDWGAKTVGYESYSATYSVLGMRWAFMRGAARQHNAMTATYRSCNFGDASTLFSETATFSQPKHIFDNYYSVYSGAGMTWYKMDIWYQYMAGASMFYHEQGFDEFWQPGGTTAAGLYDVQLSPKGKLVDRFLRVTKDDFDRGTPYTPVAMLVDYAHGWEPAPFWPNSFKNWHKHEDRFLFGDHEKMLEEYFSTAYHPIGRESEKPITSTNEVYLPGVFGDVFDVIFAYPDANKWKTIDQYPVVIATGEIELTAAEGERLKQYMERGGTLMVADAHLTGPGAAALALPASGDYLETTGYRWFDANEVSPSQMYRYRPITVAANDKATRVLATSPEGKPLCVATDRGAGRLVYLAIPRGLGIDRCAVPMVPRLFAHLTRGQMPIEVDGDVNWLLNKNARGWMVTLLNPAGQQKPQQGITPTDYRENRTVTIRGKAPFTTAVDRLLPSDKFTVKENAVTIEVPAGSVRIVELR